MIIIFVIIWYPLRQMLAFPDNDTVMVICAGKTGKVNRQPHKSQVTIMNQSLCNLKSR